MNMKVNMILAQDKKNGIGNRGKLPWPLCKDDMSLFKKLTVGLGIQVANVNHTGSVSSFTQETSYSNAVIMGYNTWKSLPVRHRPLLNRMNIVLSNSHYDELVNECEMLKYHNLLVFKSWFDIKQYLNLNLNDIGHSGDETYAFGDKLIPKYKEVWIIGGAEIYKSAFEQLHISQIYRTVFKKEYECDTFIDVYDLIKKKYHDKCEKSNVFDIIRTTLQENDDYVMECLEVKEWIVS